MMPNCERCGKFHNPSRPGTSWALVIPPDYWNGPEGDVTRCRDCTLSAGLIGPRGGDDSTHGIVL